MSSRVRTEIKLLALLAYRIGTGLRANPVPENHHQRRYGRILGSFTLYPKNTQVLGWFNTV